VFSGEDPSGWAEAKMSMQEDHTESAIRDAVVRFAVTNFPSDYTEETLPRDQSLVELGVVDSFGVVELVAFLEETWSIVIEDSDITRETMGSIDKMTSLVRKRLVGSQG
jgi:acyl carrier protein